MVGDAVSTLQTLEIERLHSQLKSLKTEYDQLVSEQKQRQEKAEAEKKEAQKKAQEEREQAEKDALKI